MRFLGITVIKDKQLREKVKDAVLAEQRFNFRLNMYLIRVSELYRKRAEGKVCNSCPRLLRSYLAFHHPPPEQR